MGGGLYVHIPFCPQKCPYCSFAVVVGRDAWHERYIEAVCSEMRHRAAEGDGRPLATVYFGGGTPSMVEPALLGRVLQTARAVWGLEEGAEISLEANPDAADSARFSGLRRLGFNRLTVGVQSFGAGGLDALGRRHTPEQAWAAVEAARQAGFDNIGIDLIFGVPGWPEEWQENLEAVERMRPEHVSTYGLTVEEDTRFFQLCRQGNLEPVGEERQAAQYQAAVESLQKAGYGRYEVSNFALPGRRCRHNWAYWTGGEYVGVGMGAHSFVGARRRWNLDRLVPYVEAIESGGGAQAGCEELDAQTRRRERLWLELRTVDGAQLGRHEATRLQASPVFEAMRGQGWVDLAGSRLRLQGEAFALADAVGVEVAAALEGAGTP